MVARYQLAATWAIALGVASAASATIPYPPNVGGNSSTAAEAPTPEAIAKSEQLHRARRGCPSGRSPYNSEYPCYGNQQFLTIVFTRFEATSSQAGDLNPDPYLILESSDIGSSAWCQKTVRSLAAATGSPPTLRMRVLPSRVGRLDAYLAPNRTIPFIPDSGSVYS